MSKKKLKLFVLDDGFCPDYTDGLAVAIAEDEPQARKLVEEAMDGSMITWGTLTTYRLDQRRAFAIYGGS